MTDAVRRWWPGAVLAAGGVAFGVVVAGDGRLPAALVGAGLLAVVAWSVSPLRGRGAAPGDAGAATDEARSVVVYWRPGCAYSERLKLRLRRTRGVVWVNIWDDPAAAAFVREHNDGDETVPTVVMDGQVWTNPDPKAVRKAARRVAP